MEIEYVINKRDVVSFHFHHLMKMRIIVSLVATVAILALDLHGHSHAILIAIILFPLVAMSMFLFILGFGLLTLMTTFSSRKNRTILTKHRFMLGTDEFTDETEFGKSTNSWRSVVSVTENRRLVMIYVQQSAAHLIPKRAFRSDDELQHFVDTARSSWKAVAKSGAAR